MEITKVFKACVKAAKMRNKDIMPKRAKKEIYTENTFNSQALEVVASITKLKQFLLKYQADYLSEFSPISTNSMMTEAERDQIEDDAQTFIKSCNSAISALKSAVDKKKAKENNNTRHSESVVELLETYLREVSKLYSQLRAFRVKQAVDRKQMSKLKPDHKSTSIRNRKSTDSTKEGDDISKASSSTNSSDPTSKNASLKNTKENTTLSANRIALEEKKAHGEFTFTPEETQIFEEENNQLYKEMNNLVNEIQNIEGKVMEIGQLQEIFQEKVMSQSEQIGNIHTTAVTTTENVKEGNEQIREAIKNSATFRVWVLFFLVMCTFSLLFLDWYNP